MPPQRLEFGENVTQDIRIELIDKFHATPWLWKDNQTGFNFYGRFGNMSYDFRIPCSVICLSL